MTEKEEFRKDLFNLKLKQYLFAAEHKNISNELKNEDKQLKKVYAKKIVIKEMGDGKNDKY